MPLALSSITLLIDSTTVIQKTAADSGGHYILLNVSKNKYLLKVSFVGYQPFEQFINFKADTTINVQLHRDTKTMRGVVVNFKKPLIERKIDRLIFNIDGNVNFVGLNAMDVLERAPLLDVRDDAIKKIGGGTVAVMIDGRLLAYLNPFALANKLKSIPAENILRIEIITNPSAEYDAQGIGGIVNIVLKKNKTLGYSGSINSAYSRIEKDNVFRVGLDFNYNVKNLRTFLNFGTAEGRVITNNSQTIYYPSFTWNSSSYHYEYTKPYFTAVGFENDLSKKSSIGASFNCLLSYPDQRGATSVSVLNPSNNQLDSTISVATLSDYTYKNYALNLHYNHKLDSMGGQLNIDCDWVKNNLVNNIENDNENFHPDNTPIKGSMFKYLSLNEDISEIRTLNAIVERPREKYTITYGCKFSFIKSSQFLNQYNFFFDPSTIDTVNQNAFSATENIQAFFGTFDRTIKKFEFKVGLRTELTQTNWNTTSPFTSYSRKDLNFFPSAYASYHPNDNNTFALDFGRHFQRPNFWSLNPNLVYINAYTFYQGNPLLKPYFTNDIEFSYTYKSNLTLGLGYRSVPNSIYGLPIIKANSNVVINYPFNYITSKTYEADCFYGLNKIKNLQSNIELTGYYTEVYSSIPETVSTLSRWSGNLRVSNSYYFNKAKTFVGGLIFNWQLPEINGITTTLARHYLDMSLKHSFFKRNLDITFTGRDIFKTNNFYDSRIVNGIHEELFANDHSRRFALSIKYSFGNNKMRKGSRHNEVGNEGAIIAR